VTIVNTTLQRQDTDGRLGERRCDMEKNRKLKVALIDDNKDYLFTMETFLKRNGFDTVTATDGKTGIALLRKEQPDVILLDIMMETLLSGFEVCRVVRSDPSLEKTPIIGISGMGDELDLQYDKWEDREYFDPDDFIEKPVDKELLLSKIEAVITNRTGKPSAQR
jgi:DNA-binding response OmpR family regulator